MGLKMQTVVIFSILALTGQTWAQSNQYSRKKPAADAKAAPAVDAAQTPAATGAAAAAQPAPEQGDKLDISDLEQKYWAPKDTDFSVVQNRTYTKAKRFSLAVQYGHPINDTFSSGNHVGLTANYFLDERTGFELTYVPASLQDSKATTAFKSQLSGGGVLPDFNRTTSYVGAAFNWVPFYAKMSVLGQKIIYFDMAISPGIGMTTYDQMLLNGNREKTAVTATLDITQYYFLSKHIAIRADIKNRFYQEEVVRYKTSGTGAEGTKVKDETNTTTIFMLGVTYFH